MPKYKWKFVTGSPEHPPVILVACGVETSEEQPYYILVGPDTCRLYRLNPPDEKDELLAMDDHGPNLMTAMEVWASNQIEGGYN